MPLVTHAHRNINTHANKINVEHIYLFKVSCQMCRKKPKTQPKTFDQYMKEQLQERTQICSFLTVVRGIVK